MARWLIRNKKGDTKLMSKTLNISETLSQVLINRDIRTKGTARKFLNPSVEYFHDSREMKDMCKAINILKDSIARGKKIAIYGDYDVDGIMSTTILYKGLKAIHDNIMYYIPDRKEEGYGLNIQAIKKLKEENVDLLITCDNGIAALEEIKYANSVGIQSIIIDHHESVYTKNSQNESIEVLPQAEAIVNPKQKFCDYKFKKMCAGGLCYKFICTYYEHEKKQLLIKDELLIFASIATFCDIVDLQDENRIIAACGLKLINSKVQNIGLKALLDKRECKEGNIDEYTIGFVIGPCINAAGRLKHAQIAVELFLTQDKEKADMIAAEISHLNDERKLMTKKAIDEVMKDIDLSSIDSSNNENQNVIVVYNKDIHESIAGIVAGKIKDKLYRPTILITQGEHMPKGSARSIENYNIFEELSKCRHLFDKFGGHEMAAGLSLLEENIEKLRVEINKNFSLKQEELQEVITIEKAMYLEDITYELANELNILKPFGKDNKEPLFGTKMVKVESLRVLEDKDTLIFTFSVGNTYRKIKGICFGEIDTFREMINSNFSAYDGEKILNGILSSINLNLDIVYSIDINIYNGDVSVQLRVKDFRISNI